MALEFVISNDFGFETKIWLVNRDRREYLSVEDGVRSWKLWPEVGIDDAPPPLVVLPGDVLPELMEALIKQGTKPPAESFNKGKLDATERHLEDMRSLVFKNKPKD